ncbi:MAG: L,D-transpeptidase [Muribaculaceae bacterium]|nr:L,D-transpeptidase [Muribaculaceae bacterium]
MWLIGVLVAALCQGCGRHHKPEDEEIVIITDFDSVMPDTMPELPADTTEAPRVALTKAEDILRAMEESPDHERYARGILPQMAEDVPEYAGKLLINECEGFLIVDKNTMKLYRYDRFGVEQERVGIAVAKNFGSKHKRRDGRTPEGYFTIEGIYDSTEWLFTDDDGNTSQTKGQFGPRYMRLRTPVSSQIGIHGTVSPWSIGGRRSHGCIRMLNENILRFAEICKAGWPVIVSPGPRDMRINEEEGYDIPSVAVIPGRPRCKAGKAASTPLDENKTEDNKDTVVTDTIRREAGAGVNDNVSLSSAEQPEENDDARKKAQPEPEPQTVAAPDETDPYFN